MEEVFGPLLLLLLFLLLPRCEKGAFVALGCGVPCSSNGYFGPEEGFTDPELNGD